jgi:HEAT repeat protein
VPPRKTVDDKLAELEAAAEGASTETLAAHLVAALGDRHYRVVARAARLAGDSLAYDCVPALLEAYPRFLSQTVKRDPSCLAKKAVARALYDLDCDDVHFYLEAIRYRQMEPVWGGTVDTAADLRSSAAMGLVASGYPRALVEIAELLTDSEPPVRAGAARAIACGNPREAEQLLRLKVLTGDEDPLVLADCFAGLLTVEPDESPAFVARFLDAADEAVVEAAVLALGESRIPAAIDLIKMGWEGVLVSSDLARAFLRAAAFHRSEQAFDWMLEVAATASSGVAGEVIEILSIYRHNDELARRLRAAVEKRDDDLLRRFDSAWGA